MESVKLWYIGTYGGEAQARPCSPAEFDIIHAHEDQLFVKAEDFDRVTAEREALQLLLNNRDDLDDQLTSLEQRRYAEQQAREAAERRVQELQASLRDLISAVRSINRSPAYKVTVIGDDEPQYRQRKEWIDWVLELCEKAAAGMERTEPVAHVCTWSQDVEIGIWNSTCGSTWSFHDDGPEENGMKFCHSCGNHLVVEVAEPEQDNDWRMNPCKQGHRDVGAAGGVAHCYTCDEKIEAATTQEAYERWNATHPQQ